MQTIGSVISGEPFVFAEWAFNKSITSHYSELSPVAMEVTDLGPLWAKAGRGEAASNILKQERTNETPFHKKIFPFIR
jgi:hypothetical protein